VVVIIIFVNKPWNKSAIKRIPKKKPSLAGGNCPRCGKPLVNRTNRATHKTFIGCSGYPACDFILHEEKGRIEYVGETFPNGWTPNYSRDVTALIEKCASRPEMKFLFGAAYYLDHECGIREKPMGLTLFKTDIAYEGKSYEAVRFDDPYRYWGGGTAPSAMAFVPQLEFAGSRHHDFGIFFADTHSPAKNDWYFEMAVEVDFHPEHVFNPGKDKYRDSLVKHHVLRLRPEADDPLTWFKKVQAYWDKKVGD